MKKWFRFTTLTTFVVLILLTAVGTAAASDGNFDGAGDGTENNPYIIEDAWDLYAVRYNLSAAYSLNSDIDIGSYATGNTPVQYPSEYDVPDFSNWTPIGGTYGANPQTSSSPFKGTFDGNGYEISNYTITRPYRSTEDYVQGTLNDIGLFGFVSGATIKNLTLNGTNSGSEGNIQISSGVVGKNVIANGSSSTGILTGRSYDSVFEDITILNASVYGTNNTAALAGYASNNTIRNITIADVNVSSTAYNENTKDGGLTLGHAASHVGILIGFSRENEIGEMRVNEYDPFNIQITDSEVTGTYFTGMLVGKSENDTITNVEIKETQLSDTYFEHGLGTPYASKQAPYGIGGIAGSSTTSSITDSRLEKITFDTEHSHYVGGLVGQQSFDISKLATNDCIKNCSVENLTLTAYHGAGGLVGNLFSGKIENCYVTGDASTGETVKTIEVSLPNIGHTTGGTGGLVGSLYSNGSIINSNASIDTYASLDPVGGLVGYTNNTVNISQNCYAAGNVTAEEQWGVGGFIGYMDKPAGTLESCYASGDVSSANYAGGFIGRTQNGNIAVEYCYATGNVSAPGMAGGFIAEGTSLGTISNCYATGDITGTSAAGGFGGQVANVTECFATGNVTIDGMYGLAGGFAAYTRDVSECFATGEVDAPSGYAGGFTGRGSFSECYAVGDVFGKYAGGLVGQVYNSNISNSYASGNVTGEQAGGLIGAIFISDSGTYTIENCMALGEYVNTVAGNQEDLTANRIYGAYAPLMVHRFDYDLQEYCYDEFGKPIYDAYASYETYNFQNNYAWNGIQNENGEISNKLNENNDVSDDVTLVKSYNVWDTFGKSNDALRNSAWDSSWDSNIWKLNHYTPTDEYLLPIFKWQTIEKQNPEANAVYLLYLTQIDIKTGDGKTENTTDFKVTVDEKEVEYGKSFFNDWEWNLKAAYSDDPAGSGDNVFDILKNIDNSTKTYTTDVKDLSAIAEEPELYAWGTADLVKRTGPDATTYITARLGERYSFSFAENESNQPGGSSGGGSSGTGSAMVGITDENPASGFEEEISPIGPGNEMPDITETGIFSWMPVLSLIAISIAVFIYRRQDEEENN